MGEQLIEAARHNNIDLLDEIINSIPNPKELASLLNNTKTPLGNYIYHVAALQGNCMKLRCSLKTYVFK